ncbi:MAG TPA: LamG domain-containing protein [Anaerolineae bacterium]|nr:LamG domain-containing protein [Anaerolineae bacterium]
MMRKNQKFILLLFFLFGSCLAYAYHQDGLVSANSEILPVTVSLDVQFSTDGVNYFDTLSVPQGNNFYYRIYYDNSGDQAGTNSTITTTLPTGFNLVPGSTRTCLEPTPGELVCNTDAGMGGAINEGGVWSGQMLAIAPQAGLYAEGVGATAGMLEFGRQRYLNLHECQYFNGSTDRVYSSNNTTGTNVSNITDTVTSCAASQWGYAVDSNAVTSFDLLGRRYLNYHECQFASGTDRIFVNAQGAGGTNTANVVDGALNCAGTAGAHTLVPAESSFTTIDLGGNRYLNYHECRFAVLAPVDNITLNAWTAIAGSNASNTIDGSASCSANAGAHGAIDNTILVLDMLDTTRGTGFVEFQVTANAAANVYTQNVAIDGNEFVQQTDSGDVTVIGSVADNRGNALDFDGINDYIAVPGTFGGPGWSAVTIEAWVRPRSTAPIKAIVSATGASFVHFQLPGDIVMYGGSGVVNLGSFSMPTNEWHHLAVVFSSGDSRLYLDGVEIASSTATITTINATTNLRISSGFGGGRFFNGQIDEVRIWNTARTEADIITTMYTELTGNESGLVTYYRAEDGQGNNNSNIMTATDLAGGDNNGTLMNMDGSADWQGHLWTADAVAATGGITMTDSGFLQDDGDDITFWFTSTTNSNVTTDLPATVVARWARGWGCDVTDVGSNGGTVDITFDYANGLMGNGQPPAGPASNYVLLHRSSSAVPFTILVDGATGYDAGQQTVTFNNVPISGLCSEITLGTKDIAASPTAVTVQMAEANGIANNNWVLVLLGLLLLTMMSVVYYRRNWVDNS